MKKYLLSIVFPIVITLLSGCSGGPRGNKYGDNSTYRARAFELGKEDAVSVMEQAADRSELCMKLLDVRARITLIRNKMGEAVADDYEAGFRSTLEERGDSLSVILFN